MINLSHHSISMLYPERGEYKTASFPRLYSSFLESQIEDEMCYRRDDRSHFFSVVRP